MSSHTFRATDCLGISVTRADYEDGDITLTIDTDDGEITIDCGRFQVDADQLRGELELALVQAREILNDWEDRPDEGDGYVTEERGEFLPSLSGKRLWKGRHGFPSREIAVYELARAMAEAGYYPNAWYVNERGNTDAIDDAVGAWHGDDGKLKPLPGVRHEAGDTVSLAGDDWPTWTVDADYGDMGVMVRTQGDPDVRTLASHDDLSPYGDDDDDEESATDSEGYGTSPQAV